MIRSATKNGVPIFRKRLPEEEKDLMRTIALASLLIIVGAAFAAGDTVMIHIVEKNFVPTEENGARLFASALEAGIMDSLFERGHIAFSSGIEGRRDSSVLRSSADAGGADVLVEADLVCELVPGDRTLVPREIVYSLTRVGSGEIIGRGRVAAFTGSGGEPLVGESLCFDLGLRVADRVAVLF